MAVPKAPTGLNSETGLIDNLLTWHPSEGSGVTYKVYRNADPAPIAQNISSPKYTDRVPLGSNFVYTVTAVNGDGESERSYYIQSVAGGNGHVAPQVLAIGTETVPKD